MDPRLDGPLRDALIAFLQQEGLAPQQPAAQPLGPQPRRPQTPASLTSYLDPSLARLPMVMPQAAQSGNPTSQDVGQTLGPQPGEPLNRTREQLYADTARGVNAMAASALDPLGIPSAALGLISPHARDAWRETQGQAGLGPQLAGSLPAGFGLANAMLRGGRALAGIPGMIAGGGATGAAPAIDYAAGAPGATAEGALASPAVGAMFPAGQGLAQFVRNNPAAAGGLASLAAVAAGTAGDADAANPKGKKKAPTRPATQQAQPAVAPDAQTQAQPLPPPDAQTQQLLRENPELQALYDAVARAQRDLNAAREASIVESRGPTGNRGAREAAAQAQEAFNNAQNAYTTALGRVSTAARAANPSFREVAGPILGNPLALQFGLPLALGAFTRGGGAALARNRNARISTAIDDGNTALAANNIPLATQYSTNANAMLAGGANNVNRRLGDISVGDMLAGGAAGEMAAFAPLIWDRGLPVGRPEQATAAATLADPAQVATTFARGLFGGVGAYKFGNAMAGAANNYLGGRNLIPPRAEAGSLATRIQQAQPPPPPAQQYRGQFRTDFRDTVANAVTANRGNGFDRTELLNGINVFPTRRPQLEAALREVERDLALARTAADRTAIAQRIRAGGYPNLVIAGAAAGAAAHHSLTQPRGDDGRFVGEDP